MIVSTYPVKLILYDAKSGKFVYGIHPGGTNNYYNTTSIQLKASSQGSYGEATLTASQSGTTLTLNVTKKAKKENNVSAGTLTIFEFGGIA